MYNVTVICTRHQPIGYVSAFGLCKILNMIGPEVIFEEKPPSYYDAYYIDKSSTNLESEAILLFKKDHQVEQVLVEPEGVPPKWFFDEIVNLNKRIEAIPGEIGERFKEVLDAMKDYAVCGGFKYLNSDNAEYVYDLQEKLIDAGLKELKEPTYSELFQLWKDIHKRRENEMLKNIYEYSRTHQYTNAVFLVGAAHRKAIREKVLCLAETETPALNWTFYSE
ncbi:hypothetical protein [Flavihumibacter petaseus]|uniref:Uncharacterized protein n=1 Tax=Flavihumibacter petaseus NBRC 106054 TaxID=1220578 RepID=A0A0E9N6H2_9BACT|nr:hypothetical protein [Flavihumibacter petaseus]GAO45388.1 hypothetical protein FPE01S_05_00840 [Flavihumibacter petaseus NBRC 106054]